MKLLRNLFVLMVTLIVVVGCEFQSASEGTSRKLFIIGGGSRPASMVQEMINVSGLENPEKYGVVLPMASSVPDTSAHYAVLQFQGLDIKNIYAFNFADSSLENVKPKLDSLKKASFVYIPGGVQSRFMHTVQNTDGLRQAIKSAYKSGATIAGTSAGAAVMSEIMITGDQKKYPEYTSTFYHLEKANIDTAQGMGLLKDVIIDQHFVKRARNNRLLTAIMEFPDKTGIGIDESTAIVVEGNRARVVGKSQVMVYQNDSDSTKVYNGKLGAEAINIGIYLPGDTFMLDEK